MSPVSIPTAGSFTLTAEFTGTATMSAATAALGIRVGVVEPQVLGLLVAVTASVLTACAIIFD